MSLPGLPAPDWQHGRNARPQEGSFARHRFGKQQHRTLYHNQVEQSLLFPQATVKNSGIRFFERAQAGEAISCKLY